MQDNTTTNTCCICGQMFIGWGNNPSPVKEEGVCCEYCNDTKVIPARLKQMMQRRKHSEK